MRFHQESGLLFSQYLTGANTKNTKASNTNGRIISAITQVTGS